MTTEAPDDGPRYAHEVAPPPLPNDPGLPLAMARYRAARAQGFMRAMTEPFWSLGVGEAARLFLPEFELAMVWVQMAKGFADTSEDELAVRVLHRLDDPDDAGPYLWGVLQSLGIDPESIRPYGSEPKAVQA